MSDHERERGREGERERSPERERLGTREINREREKNRRKERVSLSFSVFIYILFYFPFIKKIFSSFLFLKIP